MARPLPFQVYLRLLETNLDYRRLFFARTVSLLGDWINIIGIFTLLQASVDSSPLLYSGVLIIRMLPYAVMAPIAGSAADRFDRKRIMILVDLLRIAPVLAYLLIPLWPSVLFAYTLMILHVGLSTFFEPANRAFLPDIVERKDLATANALGAMVWSASLTLGAAVGGIVTECFGWQSVIVLNALSYVVSARLILGIQTSGRPPASKERRPLNSSAASLCGLTDMLEALTFLWRRPLLLRLALAKSLYALGGASLLVLTIVGQREFGVGRTAALGISFLYAARGIGAFLGPLIGHAVVGREESRMRGALSSAFFAAAVSFALFGQAEHWLVAFALVCATHMAGSLNWVFSTVLLQLSVPSEFRGRVFGFDLGLFTLVASASMLLYGLAIEAAWLSPRDCATWIAGFWLAAGLLWIGLNSAERFRES